MATNSTRGRLGARAAGTAPDAADMADAAMSTDTGMPGGATSGLEQTLAHT